MLRVSKYTLKRPLLGKQVVVSFDCPQCESFLKCEPSKVGHADECAFCNIQFTLDKQPLEKFLANEKQKAQQRALEKRDKEIGKDKRKAERVLQEEEKLEELKRTAYRLVVDGQYIDRLAINDPNPFDRDPGDVQRAD